MIALACAALAAAATPPSFSELRRGHRTLVVSAARADDPKLAEQRRDLAAWNGAAERDVRVVEIVDGAASKAFSDEPRAVRKRYGVPDGRFAVVLIGKDGHVADRAAEPVDGARLEALIDAMPMRRAGLR